MNRSLIRGQAKSLENVNGAPGPCASEDRIRCDNRISRLESIRAKTILLVEDEAFVREVTCQILQAAGYHVLTARSAAEALPLYHSAREVHLLVTDVVLPGASGYVLAAMLRRENSQLKVLFITGYLHQMGLAAGGDENCLPKPFSSEGLLRHISQLLAEKNSLDPEKLSSGVLALESCAQDLWRNF